MYFLVLRIIVYVEYLQALMQQRGSSEISKFTDCNRHWKRNANICFIESLESLTSEFTVLHCLLTAENGYVLQKPVKSFYPFPRALPRACFTFLTN